MSIDSDLTEAANFAGGGTGEHGVSDEEDGMMKCLSMGVCVEYQAWRI